MPSHDTRKKHLIVSPANQRAGHSLPYYNQALRITKTSGEESGIICASCRKKTCAYPTDCTQAFDRVSADLVAGVAAVLERIVTVVPVRTLDWQGFQRSSTHNSSHRWLCTLARPVFLPSGLTQKD
jgi:hypothetical protein